MKQIIISVIFVCIFSTSAAAQASCPKIEVLGPSRTVPPGNNMDFYVTVGNWLTQDYKYQWSVSSGTIMSGQGTTNISVGTNASMAGSNITAMAKVFGLAKECRDEGAETGSIAARINFDPIRRDLVSENQARAEFDNFFVELQNDPFSEGVLFLNLNSEESALKKRRWLNVLSDHIKFRKFDAKRITVAIKEVSDSRDNMIVTWLPPGAEMPLKDGYKFILAEYLKDEIPKLFRK